MEKHVALLRGINVGGNRKLPMAELKALAAELDLGNPRTYVASGNLVFESALGGEALEKKLEAAVEKRFGFAVDVIVRSAKQWSAYRAANPFPKESEATPNFVMLAVGKDKASAADIEALRARAAEDEKVELRGDAIWIWFGHGAGRSKIGGPRKGVWTTRNWRTVVAIDEMLNG
jgi:uncharacterized protein (DUF1697 family)